MILSDLWTYTSESLVNDKLDFDNCVEEADCSCSRAISTSSCGVQVMAFEGGWRASLTAFHFFLGSLLWDSIFPKSRLLRDSFINLSARIPVVDSVCLTSTFLPFPLKVHFRILCRNNLGRRLTVVYYYSVRTSTTKWCNSIKDDGRFDFNLGKKPFRCHFRVSKYWRA